ncbi:hypothetical protein T10_1968 [Trichinella papuae]|uniref:Integrase catalytic domain-containing protein n=1 Tax=Trichinella papuae TaxID=268474 RepID=A0A0V1M1T8_9BILA|nr:hypothetical protein T10_1968 [Trichinella papuae]
MDLDASKEAQKAMLSYECGEDKLRVTAFACRTVSKQEKNCCSTQCDMLALVWEVPDSGEKSLLQVELCRRIPEILESAYNYLTGANLGVGKTLAKLCQRCCMPCRRSNRSATRFSVSAWIYSSQRKRQRGNQYILVFCDYFSMWPASANGCSTSGGEHPRERHFQSLCYGQFETIHFDQWRNFKTAALKEICRLFGTARMRTITYHPHSDGLFERMNRILLDMLAKVFIDQPAEWDIYHRRVLMAYRFSATLGQIMFSREMQLPVDMIFSLLSDIAEEAIGLYLRRLGTDMER